MAETTQSCDVCLRNANQLGRHKPLHIDFGREAKQNCVASVKANDSVNSCHV